MSELPKRPSGSFYLAMLGAVEEAILVEDSERKLLHANEPFLRMFGIPVPLDDLIGQDCAALAEQAKAGMLDEESFIPRIEALLAVRERVLRDELYLKDGRCLCRDYIPVFAGDVYRGHMWVYRDVTERHTEAVTDPLTGLYNRRGMEVFSEHFIRLARREKKVVLVVVLDIDGLKPVNDNLGHEAGDELIKGAAKVIQDVFRKSDVCCRIGGDEFAVLAISSEGFKIQERIRQAVSQFNQKRNPQALLSLSVGIRAWEPPVLLDDVIREADKAMYRVKKATPPQFPVRGDD